MSSSRLTSPNISSAAVVEGNQQSQQQQQQPQPKQFSTNNVEERGSGQAAGL
jgi:hypothetical protein